MNDQDYTLAAADLQRFAEERLRNRDSLRQEFEAAGFTRSIYTDGPDSMECERFARTVRHNPPAEYAVDICGQHVFANAGVLNP